jgi:hypothetical protein
VTSEMILRPSIVWCLADADDGSVSGSLGLSRD